MEIKLLHLYYDIMNLYGEYGNIKILEEHLKDQGFNVIVEKKTVNEEINLEQYDFIYIGSGTEKNQDIILKDIQRYKDNLKKAIEEKVILLTGNSYEILGKHINKKEALDIFDFEVQSAENRITSDIIAKSDVFENKIVGFVNCMNYIENNRMPLFKIEFGVGQNKESKEEGIIYKDLIGTHLIGPILIRNPEILKKIIEKICLKKDKDFNYNEIEYIDEERGYELVLNELEARSKQ